MSTIEKTELNFNSIEYGQDKLSKIVLIHKYMSSWWKRLNILPTVLYRSSTIQYKDINMFVNKKRCDNDKNNKNREIRRNVRGRIKNETSKNIRRLQRSLEHEDCRGGVTRP